jgi:hypothetical protein
MEANPELTRRDAGSMVSASKGNDVLVFEKFRDVVYDLNASSEAVPVD